MGEAEANPRALQMCDESRYKTVARRRARASGSTEAAALATGARTECKVANARNFVIGSSQRGGSINAQSTYLRSLRSFCLPHAGGFPFSTTQR
jgi:hypothetical protein